MAGSLGFLSSCMGIWGTRSCFLREVRSAFELRGAPWDSSPVAAGINRASSRVEARTSGFISISDIDLGVSVEFDHWVLGRPTGSVSAFRLTDSETEASSSKLQAPPRPAGPKGRDSALPLQGLTAQADPASNHPQSPEGPLCQLLAEGPCFPSPTLHQQGTEPPRGAGGGRGSHSGRGVQAGNVGAAVSPCTPQGHKNPIFPAASLWGPPQGWGWCGQRSFWVIWGWPG